MYTEQNENRLYSAYIGHTYTLKTIKDGTLQGSIQSIIWISKKIQRRENEYNSDSDRRYIQW